MRLDLANLPTDVALLHRLVRDMTAALESRNTEIDRLQTLIKQLQRARFGRRSERLDADQLALGLEDLDADLARVDAVFAPPADAPVERLQKPHRPSLPDHLPRAERVHDLARNDCPDCGGHLHSIGETVSEMLDWVPAELRVLRIRRPKYGCRSCGTIHQSPAPERPIARGLATPGLIAQVLVGKYCDHLPLYRQARIFARHGIRIERSTLADWVGGACWWLEPLHARLAEHLFASTKLFADDTPVPVLDPGRGRTKTGRLWVYARDDRPWGGPDPPAAVYFYSPDRKAERPASHLGSFHGVLQVDGYAGFESLAARGDITLAACWAHTRRRFYEFHQATGSPIAAEALRRIAEIYAVEQRIRGRPTEARREERATVSRPLVDAMKVWLEGELPRLPSRGLLAEAIRYALVRWPALCRFLEDGRVELDTNPVERAIRPVARPDSLRTPSSSIWKDWKLVLPRVATRAPLALDDGDHALVL